MMAFFKSINRCDFVVIGWIMYMLMEAGVFIPYINNAQSILLRILIFISFYHFLRVIFTSKSKLPIYMKGLNALVCLFSVYGFLFILLDNHYVVRYTGLEVNRFSYLMNIYSSLLPIYTFYLYSQYNYINIRKINFWTVGFTLSAVLLFFAYRSQVLLHTRAVDITNNAGYFLVSVIPILALSNLKQYVRFVLLGLCIFFVVSSFKKGAIITGTVSAAMFLYHTVKSVSKQKRILYIVFAVILVYLFYDYLYNLFLDNDYFYSRIEQFFVERNAGERENLYSTFYNFFLSQDNIINILLGNGAYYTLQISDNFAHNDWLEIAVGQGLLGLIVYVNYWIATYRMAVKSNLPSNKSFAMLLIFVIYLLKTMFSMSYDAMNIFSTYVIGYCVYQINFNYGCRSEKE